MSTCAIMTLLLVGVGLELAGIALVGWDVIDARRARSELSRGAQLVQVGAPAATAEAGGVNPEGGAATRELGLEERVDRVEREVAKIRRDLDELGQQQTREHREMLDRVGSWVAEARRETFDLRQELRPLIGEAVAGSLWRRALGVGLFALGLVAQTIANVAAL